MTNNPTVFTVITHHGKLQPDGTHKNWVVRKRFPTFTAAKQYADSISPDTDGSMYPNIPEASLKRYKAHKGYQTTCYWVRVNEYAAIIHTSGPYDGGWES